jgi:predicted RNase H-like nuclease (RuvC/YqgF family)
MATKKEIKVNEEAPALLLVQEESINPLQQKVVELEGSIKQLQEQIKDLIKTRDTLTQQVFDRDKQITKEAQEHKLIIEAMKKEAELKAEQTNALSTKFNDLAKLFDEYIKGADDMIELSKLFLRNNLRTQELLQNKIKAFNGEEGDKK